MSREELIKKLKVEETTVEEWEESLKDIIREQRIEMYFNLAELAEFEAQNGETLEELVEEMTGNDDLQGRHHYLINMNCQLAEAYYKNIRIIMAYRNNPSKYEIFMKGDTPVIYKKKELAGLEQKLKMRDRMYV